MSVRAKVVIAASIGAGVLFAQSTVAGKPDALLTLPFRPVACTTACWDGVPTCPDQKHYAWDNDINYYCGSPHAQGYCATGSCDTKHGLAPECDCPPEDAEVLDVEPVRAAIMSGDASVVRQFLSSTRSWHPEINSERRALQLLDCKSRVVLHLPLSEHMIRELKAADL
jgi:hypothetical protein